MLTIVFRTVAVLREPIAHAERVLNNARGIYGFLARESQPPQEIEVSEDLDRRPALKLESTGFCEAPDRIARLITTLEKARGSKVCITIIGHPDPDSIASAMAL